VDWIVGILGDSVFVVAHRDVPGGPVAPSGRLVIVSSSIDAGCSPWKGHLLPSLTQYSDALPAPVSSLQQQLPTP
jgi:hypothetical protein